MIYDGHAHLGGSKEQQIRRATPIPTFLCGTDPIESKLVAKECHNSDILIPTYGLHPWKADQFTVAEMIPYLEKGRLIGEIGMDCEWCDVLPARQQAVFQQQLDLAGDWDAPVILHTKGREQEVLAMISRYKNPFLVHWYASEDFLDGYIKQDCFFTVGPDASINPAVKKVIREVSIHRLLVETDGIKAVEWALNKPISAAVIPGVLKNTMELIAAEKKLSLEDVERYLEENFTYLNNYRFKN